MSNKSFKEQLITNFIPRIEVMMDKEKEHFNWLVNNHVPDDFIQTSLLSYLHLEQRLKEYKEYAENLED